MLQCEILIKKVEDWSKDKKSKCMLKAYLIEVLLDIISGVLSNYGNVFIPLKELIMECIFYNCSHLDEELKVNCIPYFSIAEYFSQKVLFSLYQ